MKEPIWLQEAVATAIHRRQLAEHGGLDGIRDSDMLSSALARPKNAFAYSQPKPDIPALAAAYAFGIAKNHPFVDGNKRTAYVLCRTFLKINGHDIEASNLDKYQTFMGLAEGTIAESQLADWIRSKLV
jgi:death-on-curing protein